MTVELMPGGARARFAAGHVETRHPAATFAGLGLEDWAARQRLPELGPRPRYGPHRPEDVPPTVTVWGPGRWPVEIQVPRPAALVRQREQINTLSATRRAASGATHGGKGEGSQYVTP